MNNILRYCALSLSLLCIDHALGMQPGQQLSMRENITHIKGVGEQCFKKIKERSAGTVDGAVVAVSATGVVHSILIDANVLDNQSKVVAAAIGFPSLFTGIKSFFNISLNSKINKWESQTKEPQSDSQGNAINVQEVKQEIDYFKKEAQWIAKLDLCLAGFYGAGAGVFYFSDGAWITVPYLSLYCLHSLLSHYRLNKQIERMKIVSQQLNASSDKKKS